jgi:excisionase family DNA binding protein
VHYMQEMQHGSANGSRLLTATQVQSRLGVDRSTVYRMALDGRLSAVKVGRQWRFPAARIDGLLATIESPLRMDRTPAPMGGFAVPRSTVVTLITVTAELLGVMMFVTDMDGHPLTEVANPCPWFVDRAADPSTLKVCIAEWQTLADDVHLSPQFRTGPLGFECARSYVRSGHTLVGMVLAGGVSPISNPTDGLYALDAKQRVRVLETLPRIAAALSRAIVRPQHGIEVVR